MVTLARLEIGLLVYMSLDDLVQRVWKLALTGDNTEVSSACLHFPI